MTQLVVLDAADILARLDAIQAELAAMRQRPEWMTVPEYARMMGASERTVRRWIAAGKIESRRHGRKVTVRG